jgi:hypothetical protein
MIDYQLTERVRVNRWYRDRSNHHCSTSIITKSAISHDYRQFGVGGSSDEI